MVRSMTPALDAAECPRPASRVEVVREVAVEPSLPANLEEQLEIRAPEVSLSRRTATGWLAERVFGGTEPREGWLADDLSNVLSVGVLSCQLLTDVSLQTRYGLRSDFWWQVLMVDTVSHGLAQGIAWVGRRLGEPDTDDLLECRDSDDPACGRGVRPSGRATMGFTSAGLMCLHQQMAGGGDWGQCAGGIAMAATIGAVRALSHEHRFSDVALSAGMGLFAGYLVPLVTFYGLGGSAPRRGERTPHGDGVEAWVSPTFSTRGLGMQARGRF